MPTLNLTDEELHLLFIILPDDQEYENEERQENFESIREKVDQLYNKRASELRSQVFQGRDL